MTKLTKWKVFETLRSAWKIDDLRRKMIFSVVILLLYRIGAVIPVPFVDAQVIDAAVNAGTGNIFQYLNVLSGQAFSQATLFALGVSPYITASIVMQLLGIAIPALERLQKSGEEGRKKITQITRFVTIALALLTAFGYYKYMQSAGALTDFGEGRFGAIVIIACYTAGASLVMWLAEKIDVHGLGNGISLILFINILSSIPTAILVLWSMYTETEGVWSKVVASIIIVFVIASVFFIVFVTNSERRLRVVYAKRVVGRKMMGGQSQNLPIKLNMSGVMPIIFANAIVSLPATIQMIWNPASDSTAAKVFKFLGYDSWFYAVVLFLLIVAFAYFYIAISFNPVEVANNLQQNGGTMQGRRPGQETADYIARVLGRITLIGALFLGIIAVFPLIVNMIAGAVAGTAYSSIGSLAFGGTSILIAIGVVLETARDIETQMAMYNHRGFLE